jgi:NADH-quinone oxidoreductase subunit C
VPATAAHDPIVLDTLQRAVPAATFEAGPATDMPTLYVDRDHVLEVFTVLRDDPALQFRFLVDVTAVDYLPAEPRWEMVYHFACLGPAATVPGAAPAQPRRLRVKSRVPGNDPRIASVTGLFPTANWPEREVFDLMGIAFENHPDLRRILTPDDWTGHPLRKDYPVQIRKDAQSWEPIQVSVEEFAESVRASREAATRAAKPAR